MDWTFDLQPSDVFWCTADIGWITGHTYVAYGPLAAGATQIIFEGVPTYPNAGSLLADDRAAQVHDLLHGTHCHPLPHQGRGR
jgi:acyl-coenzyme A synthetase/AMP-(fatty) acid ligase